MKIRQLPETLANKIAAGEVVERPASVVKELIENSIDAGSTWIKVDLQEAGLQSIKITDDGAGMSGDDCKQSILRHATSKIKYDSDLFHIRSLGFRGEALASIASVSKLTIQSSTGKQAGTKLYIEAGKIVSEEKSDARQGTEITVENLFYNTPARLKYMKTVHTELSHITDLINRYALARPHIRFEVVHNNKSIFSSSGRGDVLHVLATIYGMTVARKMIKIQEVTNDFELSGFISKPEVTRSSRNYITLIINGRYIKNQPLTHAILRAYHTLLPLHRAPIVVLSIKMDPILVDVNVHPTKLEVRFSKEKELISLIEHAISAQFKQENLIPTIQKQNEKVEKPVQTKLELAHSIDKKYDKLDNNTDARSQVSDMFEAETVRESEVSQAIDVGHVMNNEEIRSNKRMEINHEATVQHNRNRVLPLYPIGQLQGTYILAQNENGFYMIDQHAAQERIKYEYFKKKLAEPENELQTLLMPLTFEFTKDEQLFIHNHIEELEKVGLYFEPFGENTYAVRSYPRWFPNGSEEETIRDMVEQIIQGGKVDIYKLREEVAILMSCKRSIKANHHLNNDEMVRLLHDLSHTDVPFTCPHGRPVIVHFTYYEIEKMFKRIM